MIYTELIQNSDIRMLKKKKPWNPHQGSALDPLADLKHHPDSNCYFFPSLAMPPAKWFLLPCIQHRYITEVD